VRWEDYAENFLGFVQLASISILLKQFEMGSNQTYLKFSVEFCITKLERDDSRKDAKFGEIAKYS
jgi:hypothetical protein